MANVGGLSGTANRPDYSVTEKQADAKQAELDKKLSEAEANKTKADAAAETAKKAEAAKAAQGDPNKPADPNKPTTDAAAEAEAAKAKATAETLQALQTGQQVTDALKEVATSASQESRPETKSETETPKQTETAPAENKGYAPKEVNPQEKLAQLAQPKLAEPQGKPHSPEAQSPLNDPHHPANPQNTPSKIHHEIFPGPAGNPVLVVYHGDSTTSSNPLDQLLKQAWVSKNGQGADPKAAGKPIAPQDPVLAKLFAQLFKASKLADRLIGDDLFQKIAEREKLLGGENSESSKSGSAAALKDALKPSDATLKTVAAFVARSLPGVRQDRSRGRESLTIPAAVKKSFLSLGGSSDEGSDQVYEFSLAGKMLTSGFMLYNIQNLGRPIVGERSSPQSSAEFQSGLMQDGATTLPLGQADIGQTKGYGTEAFFDEKKGFVVFSFPNDVERFNKQYGDNPEMCAARDKCISLAKSTREIQSFRLPDSRA